jgi:hypothetical protein
MSLRFGRFALVASLGLINLFKPRSISIFSTETDNMKKPGVGLSRLGCTFVFLCL